MRFPLLLVSLPTLFLSSIVGAQTNESVTWQALPFYADSDWPGTQGYLAQITTNEVVLQGQPARTLETYTQPATVSCDVFINDRSTSDGSFTLSFLRPGESYYFEPAPTVSFRMIFQNPGAYSEEDGVQFFRSSGTSPRSHDHLVGRELPFLMENGTVYHVTCAVSQTGQLSASVNGQPYKTKLRVPYKSFQLQIIGWQPQEVWHVQNFVVQKP